MEPFLETIGLVIGIPLACFGATCLVFLARAGWRALKHDMNLTQEGRGWSYR